MRNDFIESSLEREIDIVENDDSLSQSEKNSQIRELEADAREYYREQYYNDEYGR